jgi:putative peptide zinc metalloprotease protein
MDASPVPLDQTQDTAPRPGLWAWIREQINLGLYKPRSAPGVLARRLRGREGVYYVLRSPDAGQYLKLSDQDYFVWSQMNGQRTVKDLVVAFFLTYGAFAFNRVSQLVRELRRGGFLADRPLDVLGHIQSELQNRRLLGRGERLTALLVHHEILFPGIDRLLGRVYRYAFWLLAWPVQALLWQIILIGLAVFVNTLIKGDLPLLTVGNSYWLGLVALLIINALIIVVHELAHGLAVKHYGRQVRRGGFMIYYGYPAFFVDTMDMWLEGRRARMVVTWAGPHSGLIIGGLCAVLTHALPPSALTPWLFKTAFVAYLSVFLNLNPLLELDGYFLLIDLLDIPMLRHRSLNFVRRQLGGELRDLWRKWRQGQQAWAAGFTQEERLLATFGVLAIGYTLYSTWLAFYFWQTHILVALRELWSRSDLFSKLLFLLLTGMIVLPLGAALVATGLTWARRTWAWLERRGFFERERNVNLTLLAALALLTLGPTFIYDPWWSRYLALMPPLLLTLGLIATLHTARLYQGAEFQRVFWAWAATIALLWTAAGLRALIWVGVTGETTIAWVYHLERLASLPLALSGVLGLLRVDLRRGAAWERGLMAGCMVLGVLATLPVARWTADAPLLGAVLSVSAPFLTFAFVAAAWPNLIAFGRTRFVTAWLALLAAAVLTAVTGLLRAAPDAPPPSSDLDRWLSLVNAGVWTLGAALYALAGQRLRFERAAWAAAPTLSDEERLRQAFARFFTSLFESFQQAFGARRARQIDDELDIIAATADWDIEIDGGQVNDELNLREMTIWEQADRYREALERTVDLIDDWAGSRFVARAAQAAYDSLPWPEREALGQYVLAGTAWGAASATQFAAHRDGRWRLVRAAPLFARCSERALDLIVAALESHTVVPGTVLARQGMPVDRFVLVQSGEIEVWRRDPDTDVSHLAGELRRGGSFGDDAFFGVGHYDATYRTSVPSQILVLSRAACDRLVRAGVALATRVGASLEIVRLLSGMPLFSHLSPQQLSALASQMGRRSAWGSQIVAHAGAERHSLFVVLQGEVEALASDEKGEKFVAHVYTPGEHFGEYALFADTPYQFTYRTCGPATLLTLDEAAFDALVAQSTQMAAFVEQIGSGRLLTVQHHK